jgi:superfamily II DNA or RNA helicase
MDDFIHVDNLLSDYCYKLSDVSQVGRLYLKEDSPAILVDTTLFDLDIKEYHYVNYTNQQNRFMHAYNGVYRFLWENIDTLRQEINFFVDNQCEDFDLKRFGPQRDQEHIDPTPPEYNFAMYFEQVFGGKSLHALIPEDSYVDRAGHMRYVDFTLKRKDGSIAIELDGESFHHPLLTGKKRYKSQLFKQNSLVSDGIMVYRWSNRGMSDETKFSDQLRAYFGKHELFLSAPHYRAERTVTSLELYSHQEDAINKINLERRKGKYTFLVVLPTGTGKTEVFIEDMRQQVVLGEVKRVLVIVPFVALKAQFVDRLTKQISQLNVGHDLTDKTYDIVVQTSAYMTRHYHNILSTEFDYILVDEAHHSVAHSLRKVLEHFQPKVLIGLTATDERLDKQKLEDIFGSYEVDLTLEQAIKQGLVPPIRAFRLTSNIDFSDVRFNGKDFVKSDLNRTVMVPSRDQLIADVLNKYFSEPLDSGSRLKQGIVFCVDIDHTKRMAKLLNDNNISALSVSGENRKGLDLYAKGDVRFLCACLLLNEGWDAPQTSIIVMARPTMSKVLYTQQLGRGTRKCDGKEALYVIDVVDSYGAALQPWSLHNLFNLSQYQPFSDVVNPDHIDVLTELMVLDGMWEGERRIEPINIFNFEKEFGELLNEEQLARELFISTGTVKSWIKKNDIMADKTLPFGKSTLHYFAPEQVGTIREKKGLKERTEASRHNDFFEFLDKRDWTFSFKIVFLIVFLALCNEQGEAELDKIAKHYQKFYLNLFDIYGKVEKENSPLNKKEKLQDIAYIQRSILINPFEKFERKRFMYHSKDLNILSFDAVLWEKLNQHDLDKIKNKMVGDGKEYYEKFVEITLKDSDFKVF